MASALTVIERLLDDDAVHDQLSKAVDHFRQAASAGTVAVKRATGKQPEPKRHPGRVLILALAAGIAAAIVTSRRTATAQR
jgi:hypothetical protein